MTTTRGIVAFLLAVGSVAAGAQAPPGRAGAPPANDSVEVQRLLAQARAAAGTEWTEAFDFICAQNPNRANRPDDPLIQPTKVFDNLFAVGRSGTTVWVVRTSAGLVLIDAGYADQLETVLLPGLRQLGLDPDQVRYVLIGHGHADHYGPASYFQKRGARIGMAAADWDLLNAPAAGPAGRGGPPPAPAFPPPTRDLVIAEGQAVTVGDVTFTPVLRLKDVEYALRLAEQLGVAAPFGAAARDLFRELIARGGGAEHEARIIEVARGSAAD